MRARLEIQIRIEHIVGQASMTIPMFKTLRRKPQTESANWMEMLSGGKTERNAALQAIIRNSYPTVKSYVLKHGGNEQDAGEILQQTVVQLVEKIRDAQLPTIQNLPAYVFRACKNRWLNHRRTMKRQEPLAPEVAERGGEEIDPHQLLERTDLQAAVQQLLKGLGEKCKNLLIWSLGEGIDMKSIAKDLGYENAQTAMNIKSRCKKKLLGLVQGSPGYQQLVHQVLFIDK